MPGFFLQRPVALEMFEHGCHAGLLFNRYARRAVALEMIEHGCHAGGLLFNRYAREVNPVQ